MKEIKDGTLVEFEYGGLFNKGIFAGYFYNRKRFRSSFILSPEKSSDCDEYDEYKFKKVIGEIKVIKEP